MAWQTFILDVPFHLKYQAHAFSGIQCGYVSLKSLWEATWVLFFFGSLIFTLSNWSSYVCSWIWYSGSLRWEGSRPALLGTLIQRKAIHSMTATSGWDSLATQLFLMHPFLREMILWLQFATSTTPSQNWYTRSMGEQWAFKDWRVYLNERNTTLIS